ncbi:hypothetical protein [Actinomadura rupiterrae]|uniref:hypothetical protein n=1 Tax=Actinomadura rupiterrae TaxID=559627 RepID=UPI0020A30FD6|nr:hypothetical protein [Actinomadura rupiterrae]MCP2340148.1 hypothetical protein [Actinomadura rupiterrae]
MSTARPASHVNGCALTLTRSALMRRRTARRALCWQRPSDQERRRHQRANSSYPRVGRV